MPSGRTTSARNRRGFCVGEEVEPASGVAADWDQDVLTNVIQSEESGNWFAQGSKGWILPVNKIRRLVGSTLNRKIRKQ